MVRRALETEVEPVRAPVPGQRELAHEIGDAGGDQQAPCLDLQGRPGGNARVELVEQTSEPPDSRSAGLPEPLEIGTQRRDRGEAAPACVLAGDLECFAVERVRQRNQRWFDARHGDAAMTTNHHRHAIVASVHDDSFAVSS